MQPEDGLAPQVGVAVKDAFRCKRCRQYASIFPGNVDVHWDYHGHGVTEGDNAEKVRVQTWYGRFADGYRNSFWVVDESIRWNGEDSSRGLKSKSGLGGDEGERLIAEKVREQSWGGREGVVDEGKHSESEKTAEESKEAAAEEAPVEEMDSKEIPDDITEESENWSEEEGQEEKENFDEMAGDWVVMY